MSRVGSYKRGRISTPTTGPRHGKRYHLLPSATACNTYNDLNQPHPIIALFIIVNSQESKVPYLIFFSFEMP